MRLKRRKKRISHLRLVMDRPERINQHWSMDFVSDSLYNGRRFRVLTVVDDFSRECPALEADHSLTGKRVTRVLDRIALTRGLPDIITVDNGPEFISKALDICLNEHVFVNLHSARQIIESWRLDYNLERPHSSLNDLTPDEFAGAFYQEQKTKITNQNLAL